MTNMENIDNALTEQFKILSEEIEMLKFKTILKFKLQEISDDSFKKKKLQGIYLIEIENENSKDNFNSWATDFQKLWEAKKYENMKSPKVIKKRIKAHTFLPKWIPIYIGKSKNIMNRLVEHVFLESNSETYALKLKARINLHRYTFRLRSIEIEVINYDAIIPQIESQLRNKINPIVGRQ